MVVKTLIKDEIVEKNIYQRCPICNAKQIEQHGHLRHYWCGASWVRRDRIATKIHGCSILLARTDCYLSHGDHYVPLISTESL